MKALFISLLLLQAVDASEYYAKAEPVDTFSVKAAVSGEVVKVDENQEGKISDGSLLIMLDDKVDVLELESSIEKLEFLQNSIKLTQESVSNAGIAMRIQKKNYAKVKNLSSYTKVQKDTKLLSSISATNSYIQSKTSLQNLKIQEADLKVRIATLKDKISKKNIAVKKGLYLYKIYPNVGDYVTMGTPLFDSADTSKARLSIYLSKEDLQGIEMKKIYINDKETHYKIDKLWSIADTKNISAYKTEIVIERPKLFSTLMKVEFK